MNSHTKLIHDLTTRYATKSFDTNKKIDSKTLEVLTRSLILTPSSFGLQPWKFFVVSDQDTKESLLKHSWNQAQVTECSHLIVLAAQAPINEQHIDEFINSTVLVRGGTADNLKDYKNLMLGFVNRMTHDEKTQWAKQQVYIALGQFLLSAASLGIDACPMEGINPEKYDEVLGIKDSNYFTTLACPIGYRSKEDKYANLAKVRYEEKKLVEFI